MSKVHNHWGFVRAIFNCFLNGRKVFYSLHHSELQERGKLKAMLERLRTKWRGSLHQERKQIKALTPAKGIWEGKERVGLGDLLLGP